MGRAKTGGLCSLQHLALARDISVVVFDDRGTGNGWLLPAGLLREPWPPAVGDPFAPQLVLRQLRTNSTPVTGLPLPAGAAAFSASRRLADMGVSMADQRQVATQMAVISQVHIARLNYANAAKQYLRADKIARVDARMAEVVSARAKAEASGDVEGVLEGGGRRRD